MFCYPRSWLFCLSVLSAGLSLTHVGVVVPFELPNVDLEAEMAHCFELSRRGDGVDRPASYLAWQLWLYMPCCLRSASLRRLDALFARHLAAAYTAGARGPRCCVRLATAVRVPALRRRVWHRRAITRLGGRARAMRYRYELLRSASAGVCACMAMPARDSIHSRRIARALAGTGYARAPRMPLIQHHAPDHAGELEVA
eukprot:COSAG02_NODE_621_length_19442_cov_39.261166_8_plen_199_part_00